LELFELQKIRILVRVTESLQLLLLSRKLSFSALKLLGRVKDLKTRLVLNALSDADEVAVGNWLSCVNANTARKT
jgi:hypothetical protein